MSKNHRSEREVTAFLGATRRLIDPRRGVLVASSPYVIAGGIGPANRRMLLAGASAANHINADYIHLEFALGSEAEGPSNVVIAMFRGGVCHIQQTCRFWLDNDGRPFLLAEAKGKFATMTFDPAGMDSRPGAPHDELEAGYARAATKLREFALPGESANENKVIAIDVAA